MSEDPVVALFEKMKDESEARAQHLLNQSKGVWEQLGETEDEEPYETYSNSADDMFDRESMVDLYKQSYSQTTDGVTEDPTAGAAASIKACVGVSFLSSAIAGLSLRRLSRIRSVAAQLSRRRALYERDLDALRTVAYDRWSAPPA